MGAALSERARLAAAAAVLRIGEDVGAGAVAIGQPVATRDDSALAVASCRLRPRAGRDETEDKRHETDQAGGGSRTHDA